MSANDVDKGFNPEPEVPQTTLHQQSEAFDLACTPLSTSWAMNVYFQCRELIASIDSILEHAEELKTERLTLEFAKRYRDKLDRIVPEITDGNELLRMFHHDLLGEKENHAVLESNQTRTRASD